ncbi:hypothetical protein FOZ61_005587 [Perkinsus olseni]|uniref:Uncharacterized protein n=1 Tax=Perkinsus olseni TaxID=32597 RepID=A0A7J6LHY1_PEROL|nr:hypothetical protein FOZ61_005587 [Perkinsus olseni]
MGCGSSSGAAGGAATSQAKDDISSESSSATGEEAAELRGRLAELGVVTGEADTSTLRDLLRGIASGSGAGQTALNEVHSTMLLKWLAISRGRLAQGHHQLTYGHDSTSEQQCLVDPCRPTTPLLFKRTLGDEATPQNTPRVGGRPLLGMELRERGGLKSRINGDEPNFVQEMLSTRRRDMAGQSIRLGLNRQMPHNSQARTAPAQPRGDSSATPAFGVDTPGFGVAATGSDDSAQSHLAELEAAGDSYSGPQAVGATAVHKEVLKEDELERSAVTPIKVTTESDSVGAQGHQKAIESFTVGRRTFQVGEIALYWSASKHQWLKCRVCRLASDGRRVVIDKQLTGCTARVEVSDIVQAGDARGDKPLAAFEVLEKGTKHPAITINMSFPRAIILLLASLSMAKNFPPEDDYCTKVNLVFTAAIFFEHVIQQQRHVDVIQVLHFIEKLPLEVNVTGIIPWKSNSGNTSIALDIKNKNFTDFAKVFHFNPTEWEEIPYNSSKDAFTLSVNGTPIEASHAQCPTPTPGPW